MPDTPVATGLLDDPLPLDHELPPAAPTADELRKADFMRQVMEARSPKPPEPTPPAPSSRQMDQTTREIARGQERVKLAEDQERKRPPQPAPDPRDAHTTAVFRPSDYQHESKNAVPFKG